jgi:hypothetical protein
MNAPSILDRVEVKLRGQTIASCITGLRQAGVGRAEPVTASSCTILCDWEIR